MKKIKIIVSGLFILFLSGGMPAQSTNPPDPPGDHGSGGDQPPGGSAPLGSGMLVLVGLGAAYGGKKVFELRNQDDNE
ncbi:MAG: hypothetical protein L3J31_03155 [Bacteroidales bacterium]|nr:hypothetical protein [Bacteroidales bacterium]MCF6341787.1 hypothetical protein [Bacteroidales bacterium]